MRSGFTLVELSIVLVIIGLIVGGVLVGQELIEAARLKSVVAQYQQYNTAVNAFRLKYAALPGDIKNASNFGFQARGPHAGQGDGNGLLEGNWDPGGTGCAGCNYGNGVNGENVLIWSDLSQAGLIDKSFTTATSTTNFSATSPAALDNYLPNAKLDNTLRWVTMNLSGINHFIVLAAKGITVSWCTGCMNADPGISVINAYSIDKKLDDGLPQTGSVRANINPGLFIRTDGSSGWADGLNHGPAGTQATSPSSNTCFDNNNVANATQEYSLDQDQGRGRNCALIFKMQ